MSLNCTIHSYVDFFNKYYNITWLTVSWIQRFQTTDVEDWLYRQIFYCTGVSAPDRHIVQGSTVYCWSLRTQNNALSVQRFSCGFNTWVWSIKSLSYDWTPSPPPSPSRRLLFNLLSRVRLIVTWTVARQASLSFTISQSLVKFMSIMSVMPSNHLILCCPLLLLLSIFLSIRIFPMSQLFASGGQHIGASASASVLPVNIQD